MILPNTMDQPALRILILGSGAREHALALKLSKDAMVNKVYVAPGNPGIKGPKIFSTLDSVLMNTEKNYRELVLWAKDIGIKLAIPCDQKYIVRGLIEQCINLGIDWFGPSEAAAMIARCPIEANVFMRQCDIPTAECGIYTDYELSKLLLDAMPESLEYEQPQKQIDTFLRHTMEIHGSPKMALVMKGFTRTSSDEWSLSEICIPRTKKAAHEYAKSFLKADNTCLMIEKNLQGLRINVTTFSDGQYFCSLPPVVASNKHPESSSIFGDQGCVALTGGFPANLQDEIESKILKPTFDGLAWIDMPYIGILSTDIALTTEGPKVLGYSAHFNSVAAQSLLPLFSSETSLASIMQACIQGRGQDARCNWENKKSIVVSISAALEGREIGLPQRPKDTRICFESGIKSIPNPKKSNKNIGLQTTRGRVLGVCAIAEHLEEACKAIYDLVTRINFEEKLHDAIVGNWELVALKARNSESPAHKKDPQNDRGTGCPDPSRALTGRGTWCRGGVGSSIGFRRFDDNDGNTGGVRAGSSSESGSSAAEGDVGTLESKSTPPASPRLNSSPVYPIDGTAVKELKEKDGTQEGTN